MGFTHTTVNLLPVCATSSPCTTCPCKIDDVASCLVVAQGAQAPSVASSLLIG